HIPEHLLQDIVKDFRIPFTDKELIAENYERYQQIKNGIPVQFDKDGKKQYGTVRILDFNEVKENTYTLVSQMWIKSETQYRRPELLLLGNAMALVFIELSNLYVTLNTAYDEYLPDYFRNITLFCYFNQICAPSNAQETRIGSFTANYSHFFEWLRISEYD